MSNEKTPFPDRIKFAKELESIKKKLPFNYGVFYKKEYKVNPRDRVYNVVHSHIIDWEILKNLKQLVKKYGN